MSIMDDFNRRRVCSDLLHVRSSVDPYRHSADTADLDNPLSKLHAQITATMNTLNKRDPALEVHFPPRRPMRNVP